MVYLSDGLHEIKIELTDADLVVKDTPDHSGMSDGECFESYAKLRYRDFQRKPVPLSFSDANDGDELPGD